MSESTTPWSWACEGDEEALGVVTLLRRHGLSPHVEDIAGNPSVFVEPDEVDRARELWGRLQRRWVIKVDAEHRARLDRGERRRWKLLVAVIVLGWILVLAWP